MSKNNDNYVLMYNYLGLEEDYNMWNELSLKEKADIIKAAVKLGIRDMGTIRSTYNEYAEGGRIPNKQQEPILDGGELKEVVIRRSQDPIYILGKKNPDFKSNFLEWYNGSNIDKPTAQRLLNVYTKAGSPSIHLLPEGENRAYIDSSLFSTRDKMYVRNDPYLGVDDIIAELAHPLQAKYGNNNPTIEELNPFYSAEDYRGKTRYDFPNKFESETHEDFEPLLRYYINDNVLPGQQWVTNGNEGLLGTDTMIKAPALNQVLDSAKVYNKRKQDVKYEYRSPRSTRQSRNKITSMLGNLF